MNSCLHFDYVYIETGIENFRQFAETQSCYQQGHQCPCREGQVLQYFFARNHRACPREIPSTFQPKGEFHIEELFGIRRAPHGAYEVVSLILTDCIFPFYSGRKREITFFANVRAGDVNGYDSLLLSTTVVRGEGKEPRRSLLRSRWESTGGLANIYFVGYVALPTGPRGYVTV